MENKKPEPTRTVVPDPREQHPGQTAEQGDTHDGKGSQLERERHLYPNGNTPNAGSARRRPRIKRSGT